MSYPSQHLSSAADGSDPCDLKGRSDLIPVLHHANLTNPFVFFAFRSRSLAVHQRTVPR